MKKTLIIIIILTAMTLIAFCKESETHENDDDTGTPVPTPVEGSILLTYNKELSAIPERFSVLFGFKPADLLSSIAADEEQNSDESDNNEDNNEQENYQDENSQNELNIHALIENAVQNFYQSWDIDLKEQIDYIIGGYSPSTGEIAIFVNGDFDNQQSIQDMFVNITSAGNTDEDSQETAFVRSKTITEIFQDLEIIHSWQITGNEEMAAELTPEQENLARMLSSNEFFQYMWMDEAYYSEDLNAEFSQDEILTMLSDREAFESMLYNMVKQKILEGYEDELREMMNMILESSEE